MNGKRPDAFDVDKYVDCVNQQEAEDLNDWLGKPMCRACDSDTYDKIIKSPKGKVIGCSDCIEADE